MMLRRAFLLVSPCVFGEPIQRCNFITILTERSSILKVTMVPGTTDVVIDGNPSVNHLFRSHEYTFQGEDVHLFFTILWDRCNRLQNDILEIQGLIIYRGKNPISTIYIPIRTYVFVNCYSWFNLIVF